MLRWVEADVSSNGELHTIVVMRLREWLLDSTCLLRREFRDNPLKRHAAVWLEEVLKICRGQPRLWTDSVFLERYLVFVAGYLKAYAHFRRFADLCCWNLQI